MGKTKNSPLVTPMPETDAPKMIPIKFSVPEPLLNEARELAKAEGWSEAALHRIFWEKGFAAHAEGSNKRLVNRNLRAKNNE
jgi:hypothetical protein